MKAELYKLRAHRTPWACAAVLLVAVLTPAVVMVIYTPKDTSSYGLAFTSTFEIFSVLVGVGFAGWLLGTEYRNDTVKRLLIGEPRRLRALSAKAAVGLSALSLALVVTAVLGWSASRYVGSLNDVTIPWNWRELMTAGIFAVGSAIMTFALSAVSRSDTFAMVGTLALVIILDPLMSLIPRVGKYGFSTALDEWSTHVVGASNDGDAFVHTATASGLTTAAWLFAIVAGGSYVFARRDV